MYKEPITSRDKYQVTDISPGHGQWMAAFNRQVSRAYDKWCKRRGLDPAQVGRFDYGVRGKKRGTPNAKP